MEATRQQATPVWLRRPNYISGTRSVTMRCIRLVSLTEMEWVPEQL